MWTATYADGTVVTEGEVGSVRNAPPGIVTLSAQGQTVTLPEGALPLWLRRVSINAHTGEQQARVMIGWEDGTERIEVWVHEDGTATESRIQATACGHSEESD